MKKLFALLFFSLLLSQKILAQSNLPPVYEIKTDTTFEQDLDNSYWQMLEDKAGKWTTEEVSRQPLSDEFHDRQKKLNGKDTIAQTYWFRYRLKNTMDRPAKISLDSWAEISDFYVTDSTGKWEHFGSGSLQSWSKKSPSKRFNAVPITIPPGSEWTIYYRIFNRDAGIPSFFRIDVLSTQRYLENNFLKTESDFTPFYSIQEAFFFGFFVLAAIFNFFFFWIVREKVYLFFSLFLLFFSIVTNYLIVEVVSREYPVFALHLSTLPIFWLFFATHFIRHYFQTYLHYPKWDKFLVVINAVSIFGTFIKNNLEDYLNKDFLKIISTIFAIGLIITILSLLIIFFLSIRHRTRQAKLFIIAMAPIIVMVAALTVILFLRKFFPELKSPLDALWFNEVGKIAVVWGVLFFSWILFKRYDDQKREIAQQALDKERLAKEKEIERNQLIEQQKIELEKTVEKRTAELKHSLENLQLTQAQLIQSEKMASLGELTAGIAHEIQNPLNFVNNFSDVNKELLVEMKDEMDKGNINDAKTIADDVISNEEKINHHGKRADAIVKGMLQHSRSSTGVKEPTDINALADEYLRLAYHGLRAKDKTFNATLQTDYDETISKINITPQDIGRVLLNLYTNAFYAVQQKQKEVSIQEVTSFEKMSPLYEPTISVSTKKLGDKIEIRVRDNGNGIPQKALDKIFQPFFTTKPTGQGTGLGLSMSYDIITKTHLGIIKAETKEGEFAEFVISLPA